MQKVFVFRMHSMKYRRRFNNFLLDITYKYLCFSNDISKDNCSYKWKQKVRTRTKLELRLVLLVLGLLKQVQRTYNRWLVVDRCAHAVLPSTRRIEELKSSYISSVGAGIRRGNSNSLSKSDKIKELNVDGIFDQLRLVKNIEMRGEKPQVTVAELFIKRKKLTIEIH